MECPNNERVKPGARDQMFRDFLTCKLYLVPVLPVSNVGQIMDRTSDKTKRVLSTFLKKHFPDFALNDTELNYLIGLQSVFPVPSSLMFSGNIISL